MKRSAPHANPAWLIPALRAAATLALPYVVEALGSSLAAFRAAPLAEQRARLRTVLRSRVLFVQPAAALAARQLAKSDQGVDLLCGLIGSHGERALTAGAAAARRAAVSAPTGAKVNPGLHAQFDVDWSAFRFSRDAERRILRARGLEYLGQNGAGDDVYALVGTSDYLYLKTFAKQTAAGKRGQVYVAKAPKAS